MVRYRLTSLSGVVFQQVREKALEFLNEEEAKMLQHTIAGTRSQKHAPTYTKDLLLLKGGAGQDDDEPAHAAASLTEQIAKKNAEGDEIDLQAALAVANKHPQQRVVSVPSEYEQVLKLLSTYLPKAPATVGSSLVPVTKRKKNVRPSPLELHREAQQHLSFLDALKKEFAALSELWGAQVRMMYRSVMTSRNG